FRPKLESLFARFGESPASFVAEFKPRRSKQLLGDFVYRFNVGTDLAVLLLGMGRALRERGSLEAVFVEQLEHHGNLRDALGAFTAWLRRGPAGAPRPRPGPGGGLGDLLRRPLGGGAAPRAHPFLRGGGRRGALGG